MNDQNTPQVQQSTAIGGLLKRSVSRRSLFQAGGSLVALGSLAALAGCGSTGAGAPDAHAPYNWQATQESEYTIPIENVSGAYADGYDVQIAKRVAEALGAEPVAVKLSFDGLIDALASNQIDVIIAGMAPTEERQQSIDFSDPYFEGTYGLFVREGSPYQDATSLADLSGASVVGQKGTKLDEVIDEIPGVVHMTPLPSVPNVLAALQQGAADAATYNMENEAAYLKSNPGIVPVRFAEGEGFPDVVTAAVGVSKGNDEVLSAINSALANLSDAERQELWDGALERQPE
ncbi:transporter substrate-binding domain-containing protein [Leptogranulimonas caecicola]|uniref:transporter substrate-binding domain-containing protein n=1 Tax=Leptogranulimonas caecicola TaxID=2894156 RepID=UPI003512E788